MIIAAIRETHPAERRVALTPEVAARLVKAGHDVLLEHGAGLAAGFPDTQYAEAGASLRGDREEIVREAEILVQVRTYSAARERAEISFDDLDGKIIIGLAEPLSGHDPVEQIAGSGAIVFALELIPRISRAQSMDVLSSQANLGGYKAALMAAGLLRRMCPMMMTAAGTITPARFLILGAGVAGLQAIATARRLGAVVTGYDIRPAVKEQVQSLGARFLEIEMQTQDAQTEGGYAKALDEERIRRQQQLMSNAISESDAVITTAAVPGKKAPMLVTREMIERMKPGSVIIDMAAEQGGNCELTQPDEMIEHHNVRIAGPTDLPAQVAYDASRMYARNVLSFIEHLLGKETTPRLDADDEIIRATMLTRGGEIVSAQAREIYGLPALQQGTSAATASSSSTEGGAP